MIRRDHANGVICYAFKAGVMLALAMACIGVSPGVREANAQQGLDSIHDIEQAIQECEEATRQAIDATKRIQEATAEATDAGGRAAKAASDVNQLLEQARQAATQAKEAQEKLLLTIEQSKHAAELKREATNRFDMAISTNRWTFGILALVVTMMTVMGGVTLNHTIATLLKAKWKSFIDTEYKPQLQTVTKALEQVKADIISEINVTYGQRDIEENAALSADEKREAFEKLRIQTHCNELHESDRVDNAVQQLSALRATSALPNLRKAWEFWKDDAEIRERIQNAIDRIERPAGDGTPEGKE